MFVCDLIIISNSLDIYLFEILFYKIFVKEYTQRIKRLLYAPEVYTVCIGIKHVWHRKYTWYALEVYMVWTEVYMVWTRCIHCMNRKYTWYAPEEYMVCTGSKLDIHQSIHFEHFPFTGTAIAEF